MRLPRRAALRAGSFAALACVTLMASAAEAQPIVMQNSPTLGVALNPLCPPWNTALLESALQYQGPDMSLGQAYTVRVQITPAVNASLQTYVNYLRSLNPAITTISLGFTLHPRGSGPEPGALPGAPLGQSHFLTWTAGGNGFAGSTNFFPAGAMFPGTWYMIESRVFLTDGTSYFPGACEQQTTNYRVAGPGGGGSSGAPSGGMRPRPAAPPSPAARPLR